MLIASEKSTRTKNPKKTSDSSTKFKKLNLWLEKIGKAFNTEQQSNYK